MQTDIQYLKGIGPKKADVLKAEAGIETVEDLLYYAPRRYLDRSSFKSIIDCFAGETVTVTGTIRRLSVGGKRRRFLEAFIDDGTDVLSGVFFAGIHYFQKIFIEGTTVIFSGKVDVYRGKQIVHPEFDFIDEDSRIKFIHAGRVIPLYRSTEKLKTRGFDSRGFRRAIRSAIDEYIDTIEEPLDLELRKRLNLIPLREAICTIHFPDSIQDVEKARQRLAFNELFFLQLYLSICRKNLQLETATNKTPIDPRFLDSFISALPFELTQEQRNAIDEIKNDIERPFPMNRLLQGDVGSGKTVVSMAAALMAAGRHQQTAVMAPTEILANQHYRNFKLLIPDEIRIELLTGNMPKNKKAEILESVRNGECAILIGTHAILEGDVKFHKLGLIIIDEQHRFGVRQRAALREKGEHPDLLVMTATPIPRSLALTLYGDLDITSIRAKPLNRLPVKTIALPESRITGVYRSVEKYVAKGRQAYFVYPVIEESSKTELKSAIAAYETLKNDIFPNRRIDLLHGRLHSREKENIMRKFIDGHTDILVSTTVIEVGIDVPNATIMVIQHPERFGLSQLHQLRGRVGRGDRQSFCVLLYPDEIGADTKTRMDVLVESDDGFRIAEEDLRLRGSGEIVGFQQHGRDGGFEFTDLASDLEIIKLAREEADSIINNLPGSTSLMNSLRNGTLPSGPLGPFNSLRKRKILSLLS